MQSEKIPPRESAGNTPDAEWTGSALGRKIASAIRTANAPMSKMRSTAQTASWEEKGRPVRRAIRYGRMNSPARPNSARPAKPISVGETSSLSLVCGRTGFKKIFQRIARTTYAKIDQRDPVQNMPLLDAMGLAPERAPIKGSPVPVLQINQNCQDAEHHHAGQNSLLIHEGGSSAPRSRNAKWETATQR